MDEPLRVTSRVEVPVSELSWRFSRSSGPGGQSVNTTDSRVELSYDVASSRALSDFLRQRALERLGDRLVDGVLTITASEQRSQLRNRDAARERLARVLRDALAPSPPQRRATRPTLGSQRRRVEAKKQRGQTKRLRRSTED